MIHQSLQQKLQQKLSPRHIQLMKLLQVPTVDIDMRIKEELEVNPALEYNDTNTEDLNKDAAGEEVRNEYDTDNEYKTEELNEQDFGNPFEYQYDYNPDDDNDNSFQVPTKTNVTLYDNLLNQIRMMDLDEKSLQVGEHIIGSIDEDGYLRRTPEELSDDLVFKENIDIAPAEIRKLIELIQSFDPIGVGAYDLRECLLLQLKNNEQDSEGYHNAVKIIQSYFDEFTSKHYKKIMHNLMINEDSLQEAIDYIITLDPKPGYAFENESNTLDSTYFIPDFFVFVEDEKIFVTLNEKNVPNLRISLDYQEMSKEMEAQKELSNSERQAFSFVKQKMDSAKWFIYALKQRQSTLLMTMRAIANFQKEFFLTGDINTMKPLILKDVAEQIGMDISSISRVVKSKYVQTEYGIYALKYFFSDGYVNNEGEEVSTKIIKNKLSEIIENENKAKPFSDKQLTELINKEGYQMARRTIAKYREQLNIPVARLRKSVQ